MDSQEQLYERYVKKLSSLIGVVITKSDYKNGVQAHFKSNNLNSLEVTLYLHTKGSRFVGIDIKGVDTGYWHTAEEEDLDYHISIAKAALKGDVKFRISKLLRFKEVCFKVNDAWYCTRVKSNSRYHYIKVRSKI